MNFWQESNIFSTKEKQAVSSIYYFQIHEISLNVTNFLFLPSQIICNIRHPNFMTASICSYPSFSPWGSDQKHYLLMHSYKSASVLGNG